MAHPCVDQKWADVGRSGVYTLGSSFLIFAVMSSAIDRADVLILDTNMQMFGYTVGTTMTFSWNANFWYDVKEIK